MNLAEKEHCYLIEDVFPRNTGAGFTKKDLEGNLPQDIKTTLSFLSRDVGIGYLKQEHSSRVNVIGKEGLYEGDALFSNRGNLVLVVRTADCLPLYFFSQDLDIMGMVHMGWRSAKEGILDNINYDLSSFKVIAGVGLRSCCYKVGREFLKMRLSKYVIKRNELLYFDPIRFVKETLCRKGLKEESFFDLNICSFCRSREFHSYRRNATIQRTLSFIFQ
ncbi:MAG: polyphenol oxidase family protein [Candidatus Omnitrophota bacterium]|nr:MAG: polyphenol oxidase family protein [Candidatus Omnitrophota bacterium]